MIYLDHAATSLQKPQRVYDAVVDAMKHCAGMGRSGHAAALRAAETAFVCRTEAGALFDASPEQVVFTFNTTHGLNLAINTLVSPGARVVISGFEHNAVTRPLYARNAEVIVAGRRLFDPEDTKKSFEKAITSDISAVICTQVSNAFGYVLPIDEIAALCKQRKVPLIVDAAQAAGVLPVSLKKWDAAFIAVPGHKGLYGPQGTGLLLCGKIAKPLLYGGTGSLSAMQQMPLFLPDRVEAGTHNLPGIAGLLEGLRYVRSRGIKEIHKKEVRLLNTAAKNLCALPSVHCFRGKSQSGVLSFHLSGKDCEQVAELLGERNIAVRAGLHCAPLAHESAGTLEHGTVRVSFSDFSTDAEIETLTDAVKEIIHQK